MNEARADKRLFRLLPDYGLSGGLPRKPGPLLSYPAGRGQRLLANIKKVVEALEAQAVNGEASENFLPDLLECLVWRFQ